MEKIKILCLALMIGLFTMSSCGDRTNRAENTTGTEDPNGQPNMQGETSDSSTDVDGSGQGSTRSVDDTPGAPGSAYGAGVEAEDRPAGTGAGAQSNQQDSTRQQENNK